MLHEIRVEKRKIVEVVEPVVNEDGLRSDELAVHLDGEWLDMDSCAVWFYSVGDDTQSCRCVMLWDAGEEPSEGPIDIPGEVLNDAGYLMVTVAGYVGEHRRMYTRAMDRPFVVAQVGRHSGEDYTETSDLVQQLIAKTDYVVRAEDERAERFEADMAEWATRAFESNEAVVLFLASAKEQWEYDRETYADDFGVLADSAKANADRIAALTVTATNDARSADASAKSSATSASSAANSATKAAASSNAAATSSVKAEQARQRADKAADGAQAAIDEAIAGMGDAIDAAVDAAVGNRVDAVVETANAAANLAATAAGQASGMALRAAQSAAAADESADRADQAATDLRAAAERGDFDGQPGAPGVSPTATVSKSGRTTTVTVTDAHSTTTAQVLDGRDGSDYVLTDEDRADIAQQAAGMVSVPVMDVIADGRSAVHDGSVEFNGGGFFQDANGRICPVNAAQSQMTARSSSYAHISPMSMDYAVKAALCDGKGAAWSADEQAAARERMGIPGDFELIADVTVPESGQQAIDITRDMSGGAIRLSSVFIGSEFTVSSSSASSYFLVQMGHSDKPLTTVALPDGTKGVKYYRRMLSVMVGGRWLHTMVGSNNVGANNSSFMTPAMQNQLYGAGTVNRIYISGTFEAGSNLRIYGVRA